MSGESESGGTPGPATDRTNAPVRDPSGNVLDLVEAAIKRQDDLRELEGRHFRETLDMRSTCAAEIRTLESALADEKFAAVRDKQALVEGHRLELKGDSEKALTAALSAQKEAAAEQNKSNTLANDRLAAGLKELILNNYQISQAETKALGDKVEDLKGQVAVLVNTRLGYVEQKQEQRTASSDTRLNLGAVLGGVSVLLVLVFGILGLLMTR